MSGDRIERVGTWVLAATLFAVPLAYGSTLADPFGFVKRSLILAAALVLWGLSLVAGRAGPARSLVSPSRILGWALLASAAVACVLAPNRALALWGFVDLAVGFGLFLGTVRFARDARSVGLLLQATLASATLVAIGTLLQIFLPEVSGGPLGAILPPSRGGSTLGDPGLAAQFLVLALPFGIGACTLASSLWRQVCGGLLGIVVAALIFLGPSEGWWVGGAALVLVLLGRAVQMAGHGGSWRGLAPDPGGASLRALVIAGLVILVLVASSRMTFLRATKAPVDPLVGTSLLSPTTGDPVADRAASVPLTGTLVLRHPLGVGPGLFRHAFLEVAWSVSKESPFSLSHQAVHAGNTFLESAAETGVLGGLAIILLLFVVLAQGVLPTATAPSPWDVIGLVPFAVGGTLAIAGFLGAPLQEPTPFLLFWVTAGIAETSALRISAPGWIKRLLPQVPQPRMATSGRAVRYLSAFESSLFLVIAVGAGILVFDRARGSMQTLLGQGAFYAGRYDVAVLALGQPSARRSPDHLASVLAGSSYLRLGHYDLAVREFDLTLRRSPYFVSAYLGRAAAREGQGRWDLADADYQQALKIWPNNGEIVLAQANLNATRGKIDDALEGYRQALRINSEAAEPYFRMGEVFLRRSQYDEAIEAFGTCGTKNPKYPRLHLRLGDAFLQKGLPEMAQRYYQAAIIDDDKSLDARLRLANVLHTLGKYCEAGDTLEAARDLETDPQRRDVILDLMKKEDGICEKQDKAHAKRP